MTTITDHEHRPGTVDARTGVHLSTCVTCGIRIRATEPGYAFAKWVPYVVDEQFSAPEQSRPGPSTAEP